ncbi:MAG: riboflavin synthase subunit alpha [Paenalcaligenes sp.]
MFTGIVQGKARIATLKDHNGLRTLELEFPAGFCDGLEIGASVSVDGVCLTVTELLSDTAASFDVMLQSLNITTLSQYQVGTLVNVERAAKDGAEIGGHPLSGHVDFVGTISAIQIYDDNKQVRFTVPHEFCRYIFAKGYIAINGASLTVSEVNKQENWFEVWLIPETRRVTTLEDKHLNDPVNIEIERGTQVIVDTIRDSIQESLGSLQPLLEKLLQSQGVSLEEQLFSQQLQRLNQSTKIS